MKKVAALILSAVILLVGLSAFGADASAKQRCTRVVIWPVVGCEAIKGKGCIPQPQPTIPPGMGVEATKPPA